MSGSLTGGYGEFTGAGNKQAGDEVLNIVEGTGSHKRYFKGPYLNRYDFVNAELLNPGGFFPVQHPDNPLLYVHVIRLKGLGTPSWDDANKKTIWERCLITVEYNTFDGSFGGDNPDTPTPEDYVRSAFIEESSDSNVELITIPGEEVKRTDNGERLHMKGPFHTPLITETISIKIPRFLSPPWFAYNTLSGRVNFSAFITPSGRAFEAGTLRYDGHSTETKINLNFNTSGQEEVIAPFYDLTLKFEYNWHGWNRKFIDGQWREIVRNDNDNVLLTPDDLYALFFGYDTTNRFPIATLDSLSAILADIRTDLEVFGTFSGSISKMRSAQSIIKSLGFNVELIP